MPLAYLGFEACHTYQLGSSTPWMARYRWPILFFIAVAFWNLVGAGLFGFLINPPLSLYYMQGLNLTPLHAHTALFGVYGMLGIGLALMAVLTLLPIGTMQLLAALENGYWYARSAEFLHQPIVDLLVWMRVPGDTIFSIGALMFAWFVIRLWISPKIESTLPAGSQPSQR